MRAFFISLLCLLISTSILCAQFSADLPSIPSFNPDFMQQFGLSDEDRMIESEDELDSGNWYEKLRWWKEAKRVYTVDIHDAMEQLKNIVTEFDTKKQNILEHVKTTVAQLPVSPEAAETVINPLLADLKAKREALEAGQTQEQRIAASEIADNEKALETLKHDFDQLKTLISRLEEALNGVFAKQVKECENYEEKALEYFERIEKVLDDRKAHHYYDIVENSLENIRAIIQYLIGPLQIFIDQTVVHIDQVVPAIKKAIGELDKKGIQVRILTEQEKAEQLKEAKKREEARLKAEAEKKAREAWNNMAWYQKIFYGIGWFFGWLWSLIMGFFSYIGGLFSSGGSKPVPSMPKKP